VGGCSRSKRVAWLAPTHSEQLLSHHKPAHSNHLPKPIQPNQPITQASGDVLETAVGTGLNLPLYSPSRLTSFSAVDISPGMLQQATQRAVQLAARIGTSQPTSGTDPAAPLSAPAPAAAEQSGSREKGKARILQLLEADAAALPFPDGAFDCIVDTFSLCVFERPAAAVQEMARVLRPGGGRLLLLEHSKSDNPLLGAYQDMTNSAVQPMSKGCAWNQDVGAMVRGAGLRVVSEERHLGGTVVLLVAERV